MNRSLLRVFLAAALALSVSGVAGADPTWQTGQSKADYLLIDKSDRKLYLYREGEVLRSFDISLGLMPEGPKQREGDYRTPEGSYKLSFRNPNSDYFLSIQISYPNKSDVARARAANVNPGGQIMIHGFPNEPRYVTHVAEFIASQMEISTEAFVEQIDANAERFFRLPQSS